MSTLDITVRAEYTPNPNSLKFICSETIYPYSNSLSYNSKDEALAIENPIAQRLFNVDGVVKVFMMGNFVTVDKTDAINWKDVHLEIKDVIKEELTTMQSWAEANKPDESELEGSAIDGDLRAQIERVLDKIRPALVADGGNIELVDIIDGDVRLRMVGACGSCPSSMMTMKMGVERALMTELPDLVDSVTQVF